MWQVLSGNIDETCGNVVLGMVLPKVKKRGGNLRVDSWFRKLIFDLTQLVDAQVCSSPSKYYLLFFFSIIILPANTNLND